MIFEKYSRTIAPIAKKRERIFARLIAFLIVHYVGKLCGGVVLAYRQSLAKPLSDSNRIYWPYFSQINWISLFFFGYLPLSDEKATTSLYHRLALVHS